MELSFKTWLEVGQTGGVGGGLTPEVEPASGGHLGALATYSSANPGHKDSNLPPVNKEKISPEKNWEKIRKYRPKKPVLGDIGYF